MELVVGDEGCGYLEISRILLASKSCEQLLEKLVPLSRALQLPVDVIRKLKRNETLGLESSQESLHQILGNWRSSQSNQAKLSVLIAELETLQLRDCSEDLRNNFKIQEFKSGTQTGYKRDQNNLQVSPTVKNTKMHERANPGQKFELQSMHLRETIGIQAFNNSCMDASLVSLFMYDTHTSFWKFIEGSRTTGNGTYSRNEKIRTELNNLIQLLVNDDSDPNKLTSAKNIFRTTMSTIYESYSGEEKGVEDIMSTLFGPVLGSSPFYRIAGGDGGGYVFQTYGLPDNPALGSFPSVQNLLNHSFLDSDIQLQEVPYPGFIIKLPVANRRHMFPRVFPNLVLSLKNIVEYKQNTAGSLQMVLSAVICLRSNHCTVFVRIDQDEIHSSWAHVDPFQHSEYIANLSELLQDPYQKYNKKDELLTLLFENPYVCVYSPLK